MIFLPPLLSLLPLVFAFPLERRTSQTACGKFDAIQSGSYSLLTNLWGESPTASGSQCSTLHSVNEDHVTWSTNWKWGGDKSIKSFSNIQLNDGVNQPLNAITGMPSNWEWSYSSASGAVFNVAYDMFTSYSPGGSNQNEVMVWLAKFNAEPISYEYDYSGKPLPIAKDLHIANHSWNLYFGSNGYNNVYSFLSTNGNIHSFSGDVYEFFTYLIDNGYVHSSEYLTTVQAGTEATSGSAAVKTLVYKLTIE